LEPETRRKKGSRFLECDNTFRHMLDRSLYISRYDNNVYAGQSAYQAAELEEKWKRGCGPPPDHVVYHRVVYGIPMTGVDVDHLIKLIYDNKVNPTIEEKHLCFSENSMR
jgi:hypothetical protein